MRKQNKKQSHTPRLLFLLTLLLFLAACRRAEGGETVWQTVLPNTGIAVSLSGCTVQEGAADYREGAEDGASTGALTALYAGTSAPVLTVSAPKTQVDVRFAQPAEDGFAAYDPALPVEDVDLVFLTDPADSVTICRFDTIYSFLITVSRDGQTDRFLLVCARDGYGVQPASP